MKNVRKICKTTYRSMLKKITGASYPGIFEFDVLAYLVAVTSLISSFSRAFLASMSAMEK